ncbi:neogenin-like [Patiria miniata]|uniref:Uncharacterized protein n=1 Tax=Patiria miniata TaxID=46514 RepID=A0A913Z5X7_PATMI|nr:neogenin-like [Patiria miniata]
MSIGEAGKVAPDEEFIRVPPGWIDEGIIFKLQIDYIAAGKHDLHCSLQYLHTISNSQYNLNVTLQINGCPSGKYGGRCEQDCSECAPGVECHSFNGVCMCPLGLQGSHCNQSDPQIKVLEPMETEAYVTYGETLTLNCTAYGMPSPRAWSWTKDGQNASLPATTHEETKPYSPSPIAITSIVHAQDTSANGCYVCEFIDRDGNSYRQRVNVTVIAIPEPFIRVPQNHTALVGGNVTFTCEIETEAGTIRWVKGHNRPLDQMITDQADQYEILQPSVGVSQLRILGVGFEDEGGYRCHAGHTFKSPDLIYAEVVLGVQSDPYPECSFQDVISIISGQTLTLRCIVTQAKPAPRLTWRIQEHSVLPETYTKLSEDGYSWNVNTSVRFVPAPRDDGKRVTFSLASPAWNGSREVMATLNVSYVPIVTVSPDPVTINKGEDGTITCSAQANPDHMGYTWTLRCPNKRATNVSTGPTYTFKNINVDYDKANLTCSVGNAIGRTEKTVQIKVTDNSISTGAKLGFSISGGLCIIILLLASIFAHRYRKEIKLWRARRAGKNKEDKEFDVFISYKSSSPDEEFVMRDLIPRLEQDGYRVCVHYRYFLPGKSIIDNISDAVHRSRKTLLLLSPGFIESEWCCYEFQAALSQMLHLQTDLIPVIFKDLGPQENLSPDLQTILRTLSYVTWPGAIQGGRYQTQEDLDCFWSLLWQSLPANPLGREEPVEHHPAQLEREINLESRNRVEEDAGDLSLSGDQVVLLHD